MIRTDSTLDAELWSENEMICIHLADKPLSEFGSRDTWLDGNPEPSPAATAYPNPNGNTVPGHRSKQRQPSYGPVQCSLIMQESSIKRHRSTDSYSLHHTRHEPSHPKGLPPVNEGRLREASTLTRLQEI